MGPVKIDICAYFAVVIRLSVLVLLGTTALTACRKSKPDTILSESDMVRVLLEMHLADEKISRAYIPYDSISKISPLIRERVLQRVGIADSVYQKSMEYYMSHPEKLDKIYGILVDSLSLREQRTPFFSPGHDTPPGF